VARILLSFDDGPDPRWTPRVLDLLAAHDLHASFFVIGCVAARHPGLLRRVAAAGHAIGNHTWSHRHPWTLTRAQAIAEVLDGGAAIAGITGRASSLFRPPHGRLRRCMLDAAREAGQTTLLWTRSAVDWGPLATRTAIARRLARTAEADIVLMHDGARGINRPDRLLDVLPGFLADLRQRGWQCALP